MSSTDHEIGRVIDHLEESEQLDNTVIVVVSDNGARGEGGPNHSFNENKSSTTLHYVYNWLGERIQTVSSPDPIPVGTHVLTAEFQMTGDQSETDSAVGTLTLYVDTEAVADGPSTTQPGAFSSTGDGLCVGRDSGSAVAGYPCRSHSSAAPSTGWSSTSVAITTSTARSRSSPPTSPATERRQAAAGRGH